MIISLCVVGVVILSVLLYYFGAFYPKFDSLDKKKEFEIPALDENFVPQGLDYIEKGNIFLLSGYMSDNSPSRVYVISKETGEVLKYVTFTVNGENYVGHAGGIASDGNYVWIVGDKKLNTLLYSDLIYCENGGVVNITCQTETGNGCDFVDVYGDKLIVGEFYRKGKYETPLQHHVEVDDEETTYAVAYLYNIDHEKASGVSQNPESALTLPNQAQGISITGQGDEVKITISTSWSVANSVLKVYNSPFRQDATKTIQVNNTTIPLYELNSNNLVEEVNAPAMSEEMTVVNGRIFILFESACTKYKMINRTRTKNVLSIKL